VTMTILLALVMVGSLMLYVLLAGADYGAGFWDLFSSGPLREEQKNLIASAIRPIWEANHVWLILMLVLLFAGFPRAFGAIMTALYIPILLMLLGIVLRGSSFVFRAYTTVNPRLQRTCAYVFSASSSFTPVFAGVVLASLSDDHLLVARDQSLNGYVFNWLNPFSLCVGLFALALFAYLAAAYLTVEALNQELRNAFRRRAFVAGLVTACLAAACFALTGRYALSLREGLLHSHFALCAEATSLASLILGELAIYRGRVRRARWMVVIFAASIVTGWASAQYPYLSRPDLTIFNSVLSENVVRDVFLASIVGALLLFPSLALLLYIFKDQKKQQAIAASQNFGS
jgi:cytochrome d ubiquinol oxidase subunit II